MAQVATGQPVEIVVLTLLLNAFSSQVPKGDTAARIQLLDEKKELAHHGAMSTPITTAYLENATNASGIKSGRTRIDISGQKRKRILRSAAPTSGLWFTLESSKSQ